MKIVKRIFNSIAHRLGLVKYIHVSNPEKQNLIETFIQVIKNANFNPKMIYDVGANHGSWSRLFKKHFSDTKFILIEPQAWLKTSFEDLLDNNTKYLPIGVGETNSTMKFTINSERDDSSTFVLTNEEAINKGFKQIDVKVKNINTIIDENDGIIPDIIKIDAEGLDIEVLKGASKAIGRTEVFLVECAINCPTLKNDIKSVIEFMDRNGYRVFEITDLNRPFSNKILWLVEIAFVRKIGFFSKLKMEGNK